MSLGGYMTDDDGGLFGRALRRLIGDGLGVAAAGNQATSRRVLPRGARRHRRRRRARPGRQGVVHQLRRLGRCVRAGHRRRQHVLRSYDEPRTVRMRRRSTTQAGLPGWARWSGTSFSAPKVAARDRPGDVPDDVDRPATRGSGCPTTSATGSRTSAPCSTSDRGASSATTTARSAPLEPELARRRIAVAADAAGRPCLVRPDSVVRRVRRRAPYSAVSRGHRGDDDLEVLGGAPDDEPPASGHARRPRRPRGARRAARQERWAHRRRGRADRRSCSRRRLPGPAEPGVPRRRRRAGTSASSATAARRARPGFDDPADAGRAAIDGPPGRRRSRSAAARPARAAPPNVLVLDTGLRTSDARAEHPRSRQLRHPRRRGVDWRRSGGGTTRTSRTTTSAAASTTRPGTARSSAGIIRQLCPDARDPPPRAC